MKKQIYLLALSLMSYMAYGQQKALDYTKLVPPSPEVAELARYATVPVSHYTGIPDIQIPLGTLQCGNITVPISISYYAGGIQVDQIASNVGMGWSLHAGGVIGQSVNGLDDVRNKRFTLTYDDIKNKKWPDPLIVESLPTSDFLDSEPDIFTYNILNYSGRFLFDENQNIWDLKGDKNLKFAYSIDNGIVQWKAVDLYGIEYDFRELETSDTYTYQYKYSMFDNSLTDVTLHAGQPIPAKRWIPTAYYLNTIASPDKKQIVTFNYINETYTYETRLAGSLTYSSKSKKWEAENRTSGIAASPQFTKTAITQFTKKIKSIIGSNGESYIFNYSTSDRLDLPGTKMLQSISQQNSLGNTIKIWTFKYDYFVASPVVNDVSRSSLNYRLKLVSVTESSNVGDIDKVYNFDYYGDNTGENQMPYRTAYSGQDMWGYSNTANVSSLDAVNVRKLFSNLQALNSSEKKAVSYCDLELNDVSYPDGSNRLPNEKYTNTYTLKAIHYPTGGKSEFIYEQNAYSCIGNIELLSARSVSAGGLRIKEIRNYFDLNNYTKQVYDYDYHPYGTVVYSTGSVINEATPLYQSVQKLSQPLSGSGKTLGFFLQMSSNSFSPLYSIASDGIGYFQVTEKSNEGKIVYQYHSSKDFPDKYNCMFYDIFNSQMQPWAIINASEPYPITYAAPSSNGYAFFANAPGNTYSGDSYKRGLPKQISYYDKDDSKVKSDIYSYNFSELKRVYGANVSHFSADSSHETILGIHYYVIGKGLLTTKEIHDYSKRDTLSTIENYKYSEYDLPCEVSRTFSDSKIQTVCTRYPDKINTPLYINMTNARMINYPIEVMTNINGKTVQATLTTYGNTNGTYLPTAQFELETENPLELMPYEGDSPNSHYSILTNFLKYDSKNNLLEVRDWKTGITNILLWGYNYQYLIAEIKGATYQDVITACPNLENYLSTSSPAMYEINLLREKLPNAQITTYTYIPHIGIDSKNDIRGNRSMYSYDSAGRLATVKDNDGNIIATYQYKYINN